MLVFSISNTNTVLKAGAASRPTPIVPSRGAP